MRRVLLVLGLVGATLCGPTHASAQDDEATRASVRALANEGASLFKKRKFQLALNRFERAYAVAQVPTIGLWSARCLEKLGRLLEASERYRQVSLLQLEQGSSEVHRQAQKTATEEHEALQPRIPALKIFIEGVDPNQSTVTVDNAPVPLALLGMRHLVDPGEHEVVVRAGGLTQREYVRVAEGETRDVVVSFEAPKPQPVPAPLTGARPIAPQTRTEPSDAAPPPDDSSDWQPTVGWIGVGVGGAALVVGSVAGIMAIKKNDDLGDACPDNVCTESHHDDVDRYDTTRNVATFGLIGGIVLGGAGALLLITHESGDGSHVAAWVGSDRAGVLGSF